MKQQHRRSDRIAQTRKDGTRNSSQPERDDRESVEHAGRRSSPPKNLQQRKRKRNTCKRSELKPKRREGHANNESGEDRRKEHVPRKAFKRTKEPERSHRFESKEPAGTSSTSFENECGYKQVEDKDHRRKADPFLEKDKASSQNKKPTSTSTSQNVLAVSKMREVLLFLIFNFLIFYFFISYYLFLFFIIYFYY